MSITVLGHLPEVVPGDDIAGMLADDRDTQDSILARFGQYFDETVVGAIGDRTVVRRATLLNLRQDIGSLQDYPVLGTLHPGLGERLARLVQTPDANVLIITGKGARGGGVIRREFPEWITSPPLSGLVIAYCQAQPKDGGAGAFYVNLRRS